MSNLITKMKFLFLLNLLKCYIAFVVIGYFLNADICIVKTLKL